MAVKGRIIGTTETDFQVGLGDDYGLDRAGTELRVRDAVVGTVPLGDLIGWRRVATGLTRTVRDGYDHVVTGVEIVGTGQVVLEGDGCLLLIGEV